MKTNLIAAAIATAFLGLTSAHAMTSAEHKAAKDKIEADYKSAKAQCGTMKDNAKDVCEKEAKAKENVAKAELEQQYKPSAKNAKDVAKLETKKKK